MPNITGNIYDIAHGGSVFASSDGVFAHSHSQYTGNANGGGATNNFNFDASRSSAIYGNANTVQPPAITLIPQIKF